MKFSIFASSNSKHRLGILYALSSGFLYGLLGYFGVGAMHGGSSVSNMLFWRFLLSGLFIAVIALFSKVNFREMNIIGSKALILLLCGLMFYGPSSIVYFMGSKYIGTGLSMVIFFIYPAMIMALGLIFKNTKLHKNYYYAIGLMMIGMIFLVDLGEFVFDLMGIILALLSALFYALYIICSKKFSIISPLVSSFIVSVGCSLTCLGLAMIEGSFALPADLTTWLNLLGLSTLATAIPILLLLKALEYISSEQASILSVLEPVFVVIIGVIFLGEHVSIMQSIGIIILLSGALIAAAL